MKKFRNTYRIESIRLQGWDYGSAAAYFVTIRTKDQRLFFGDIQDGVMRLSRLGLIANSEWFNTPKIRLDMNIKLGAFVVMPDHIHGIIEIGKNQFNQNYDDGRNGGNRDGENPNRGNRGRDAMHCVSTVSTTDTIVPDKTITASPTNQFGPQRKNLAAIIRGYKAAVTKHARRIDPHFAWQPRYYEHIIRNPNAYQVIEAYVQSNAKHWQEHPTHPENPKFVIRNS